MLLSRSDPLTFDSEALYWAACAGHKEIVEMLLPLSDPLAWDSGALRGASRGGHTEIVAMLLPGSDPLAKNSGALREAAGAGHKEIVQRLAHCYRGDQETFNRILKKAGMNSSDFHFSPRGSGGMFNP